MRQPLAPMLELSHGNRQKVNLAALLTAGPDTALLLADEPTNGLDSDAATEAGRWLCERSEQGAAVLIASHDLAWLGELCGDIRWLPHGHAA